MIGLRILFCLFAFSVFAQQNKAVHNVFVKDSLIMVEANPDKGFRNSYLLFVPKGTPKVTKLHLLVEPNNTGQVSDSISVHEKAAMHLASKSSVGNNVATELRIPLLVPIFPRPATKPLVYTHALDRDVMLEKANEMERLDLQLLSMIEDAGQRLEMLDIFVHEKILMSGFSASGSFVNRFVFLHPKNIQAVATGGLNGILMLPLKKMQGKELNYPLGINDLKKITGREFDFEKYQEVHQFIYMGSLDENDAVKYGDAYNDVEREIIYAVLGENMQPKRWEKCQAVYNDLLPNISFRTYRDVGHGTTGAINLEIIRFFAHVSLM